MVILIATLLGAFVGLGGGVIIKPMLDVLAFHDLTQISFFSACAVFAMSVTSTARHIKNKTPINPKIVTLFGLGSAVGGILGNKIFNIALTASETPDTVKGIQSVLLFSLLVLVVLSVNVNVKKFHLKNPFAIVFSAFALGLVSSFIGIGGGPINVAVITVLFSFTMRDAAVYSVAIIFFSQLASILTTFINTGFAGFDLKYLIAIIPCAVLGGLIGAKLNRKCSEKVIRVVFTITVSAFALLSLYNAVSAF